MHQMMVFIQDLSWVLYLMSPKILIKLKGRFLNQVISPVELLIILGRHHWEVIKLVPNHLTFLILPS